MHTTNVSYGPRLVANPTGALRAAVMVAVSPAIEQAVPLPGETGAIFARARAQQAVLVKTLRYFGCEVSELAAPHSGPSACAVGDATMLFENGAVMMRPSEMSRRPEVEWLEHELVKQDVPVAGHIAAPAFLDGSDVLMAGNTAFIGVSKRSNALGRTGFARIAAAHGFRAAFVELSERARCLRAVAGIVAANEVLLAPPDWLDHGAFAGMKIHVTGRGDELGAGMLNMGEHHVLADVRFPGAIAALRKAGTTVDAIDLYDFGRIGITPSMLVAPLRRS